MLVHEAITLLRAAQDSNAAREFAQRALAMPDWEKEFLLGFLQYTEAHPEVLSQCEGWGCVDGCIDCDPRASTLPMGTDSHGEC